MSYTTNKLIDNLCACSNRRMELQWEKSHTKDEALKLLCDHYIKEIEKEHDGYAAKLRGMMANNGKEYHKQDFKDLCAMYKLEEEAAKHTELKPMSNGQLRGLCPIRKEKTPSFYITPKLQQFHCFGCGAKGGVPQFFMALFGWDFKTTCQEMRKKGMVNR